MPAMTMMFQVQDLAMLDKVNAGDMIKFSAEMVDGAFTVTGIALTIQADGHLEDRFVDRN
jgi:Cu/Ag efflux protein CusF